MPVVGCAALPEFPMRAGITGKWIAGHEHGPTAFAPGKSTDLEGAPPAVS